MWNVNMGGEVLGAVPVIGSGSADTVAASDAGQVTRVAANGTPKWRLDAGEPLTSMAVNGGRLGLGCLSGRIELRRLEDGHTESAAKLDSAVLRLAALADGFVGATEDGTLFAL
jgi:outer membrane protein assembly factor BamB